MVKESDLLLFCRLLYIAARGLKPEFELMQDFHIRRTKWILVDLVDGNPPKVGMLKQLWLSRYNGRVE